MKKESLIEQCYKRMKERHGTDALVFFHVDESYEAYYDDARTLTRTTGVPSFNITAARIPAVRIPEAGPWKHVVTGCWMLATRSACPMSGEHPAAT